MRKLSTNHASLGAKKKTLLWSSAALTVLVLAAIIVGHFSKGESLSFAHAGSHVEIVGTNDAIGWGPEASARIFAAHITWDRVEVGGQYTVAQSVHAGFKVLAIVGNTPDGDNLSGIDPTKWGEEVLNQVRGNPSMSIAEAGNEMYLKGGLADPVQYGKMYLAAVNYLREAGIHMRLLFNMWGDYERPAGSETSATGGWSRDASGGGWLRDAVNGVPGLGKAILANGVSTHPYGRPGENYLDSQGVGAVAAQEAVAQQVLGEVPSFYVTEYGIDLRHCGQFDGACSEQDQAIEMHRAYETFLEDPHVSGIWWYQVRDESIGAFGYLNENNTSRPAFAVLSAAAISQGQ
jgi:hypothetical protein